MIVVVDDVTIAHVYEIEDKVKGIACIVAEGAAAAEGVGCKVVGGAGKVGRDVSREVQVAKGAGGAG